MTNDKKTPHYAISWWLWNGKTFEQHELEVEAVEIAKKFSTGESSKFVNGILDKIKLERGHGKS